MATVSLANKTDKLLFCSHFISENGLWWFFLSTGNALALTLSCFGSH